VKKYTSKKIYRVVKRVAFSKTYADDIMKFNVELDRCAQLFHIMNDVNHGQRQKDIITDATDNFQSFVEKALEEILESDENIKECIQSFKTDIKEFVDELQSKLTPIDMPILIKDIADFQRNLYNIVDSKNSHIHTKLLDIQQEVQQGNKILCDKVAEMGLLIETLQQEGGSLPRKLENLRELQLSKLNELKLHRSEWRISSNKVLGEGGFGKVVPGILRNRSNVAVKIIKDPNGCRLNDRQIESIESELLIMSYLRDVLILQTYGYYVDTKQQKEVFIFLELSPYGSLENIVYNVRTYPNIPIGLSIAWLGDVASALAYIHSKQIKHRDIKAANVLVFERLNLKVCDFGLAKQALNSNSSSA